MMILLLGLVLFVTTHLVPCFPRVKAWLVTTLGARSYFVGFNLVSVVTIVFVVYGYKQAPDIVGYTPPAWGGLAAAILMLPAVYLLMSNGVRPVLSSAQVYTAHPMSWSIIAWASAHLLANGDVASVLLFSTLAGYCVVCIATGGARGVRPARQVRPPLAKEAVFILVAVLIYLALIWGHPYFAGVPLLSSTLSQG